MSIFVLLYGLLQIAFGFQQSDYEIFHHRVELISYNHSYTRDVIANFVPFNRTIRALNLSYILLVDLTETPILFSFQPYKKSLNAYLYLPFHLDLDYCKMRLENTFGINDLVKCSNIPPCPIKKGSYYINKFRPDETKFPPRLMPGEYKVIVKITYRTHLLSEAHWYGSVKTIERLWH